MKAEMLLLKTVQSRISEHCTGEVVRQPNVLKRAWKRADFSRVHFLENGAIKIPKNLKFHISDMYEYDIVVYTLSPDTLRPQGHL